MHWEPAGGRSERNGTAHPPACLWGAISQSASVLLNHTDAERDNSALSPCVFWEQGQEMLNEALSPSPFLLGTGKIDSCMLSHLDTLMPMY